MNCPGERPCGKSGRKVVFAVVPGLIVAGGALLWLGSVGVDPSSPLAAVVMQIGWACLAAGTGSLMLWFYLRHSR